jgi:cytochrome c oxidase assembly factor CtaG
LLTSLPLLHAGEPEPTGWLHSNWRLEPTVALGVLILIGLYIHWTGSKNRNHRDEPIHPIRRSQRVMFILGALTLLVALGPPIDDWSDHYLLSAHMAQHLLLMMVAMPLLIAGTPAWLVTKLIKRGPVQPVLYVLTRAPISFLISSLIVVVWHMPFAYDAALNSEPMHILEHNLFLVAAFFTWWPVLSRSPELPGLPPLLSCLYLFAQTIPSGFVGAFITFADPGLYDVYPEAQRIRGISLATDQQIAGLMMWVLANTIYLGWITVIFVKWGTEQERADRLPRAETASPVAS